MTNSSASSLLDAMGKVLHLHTGTCQYLDRETGELVPAEAEPAAVQLNRVCAERDPNNQRKRKRQRTCEAAKR